MNEIKTIYFLKIFSVFIHDFYERTKFFFIENIDF